MAYCDFCDCSMCKTGCSSESVYDGDNPVTTIMAAFPVYHTQCKDGRWICDVCYRYDVCLDSGSKNPCSGLCCEGKCDHRPELVNGEWTFWTYYLGF